MHGCEPHRFIECYIDQWIWYIVPVVLLIIGTVGNILNIIILSRRRMRKYPTTVYLLFLAVTDIASLWISLPASFLNALGLHYRTTTTFFCQWIAWFSNIASQFSIWLLVLMTVERMLLTITPVFARAHLSRKNAVIASMVALLFCSGFTVHLVFGMEIRSIVTNVTVDNVTVISTYVTCLPSSPGFMHFYTTVWSILTLVIMNIIPLAFICAGNGIIAMTLFVQKRRLQKVAPGEEGGGMRAYNNRKGSTKMLLVICGVFIITMLPYSIHTIVSPPTQQIADPHSQARYNLITSITVVLLFINFTVNFFLYFFSGSMFKQEWTRLVAEVKMKYRKVLQRSDTSEARSTNTAAMATDTKDTPLDLH